METIFLNGDTETFKQVLRISSEYLIVTSLELTATPPELIERTVTRSSMSWSLVRITFFDVSRMLVINCLSFSVRISRTIFQDFIHDDQ